MGRKILFNKRTIFIGMILALVISFFWYQKAVQAYDVVIDGKVIGQVKNREDFLKAVEVHKETISDHLGYPVENLSNIELQKTKVNQELLETDPQKLAADVNLAVEGYRLSVDGKQLFAVLKKAVIENLLEEYKKAHTGDIDKDATIKNIDFKQKVEIKKDMVSTSELADKEKAKELLYKKEKKEVLIEVKKGDNPWVIARRNNITVDELEKINPGIDMEKIFPGDKMVVIPFKARLDVITKLENSVMESIPFKTESIKDSNLYRNQKKVIKQGVPGEKKVTYDIVLENGLQVSIKTANTEIIKEPVNRVVRIGTKTNVSRGGSHNYGVVQGKRISSSFGWRTHPISGRKSFHDGLDIAASYGNGVYAFSAGRVTYAGWNGGYGKVVYIDHGNGLKTRYAHMSSIYVNVGERVQTGGKIGAVGSTGRSTGPHLHFEVLKNGALKNPLNYL